ncbi:hypothetical protein ES703_113946 [subsurface metagenome]
MYLPKVPVEITRNRYHLAIENVKRHEQAFPRATEIVRKIYGISVDDLVMMCSLGQKRWKNYLTTVKYFHKHYLDRWEQDLNSGELLNECIVAFRCSVKSRSFHNFMLHQPLDIDQMGF